MDVDTRALTEREFRSIYKKVPRLTVEIVIRGKRGVYLTQRDIEPCKGLWHLPGGTVRFGEPLVDAVKRIVRRELGAEVVKAGLLGYLEYPSHYLNGLDSPVGVAFDVAVDANRMQVNQEARAGRWFKSLPKRNMHKEQWAFLRGLTKFKSSRLVRVTKVTH